MTNPEEKPQDASNIVQPAPLVTNIIDATFNVARQRHSEINRRWISISWALGSQLPASLLPVNIQRAGELDLILRCIEDEFALPESATSMFRGNYNAMFAETWVGNMYEAHRLLREIKGETKEHDQIAHDLRLLRVALEKHQIADDRKFTEPLKMTRQPLNNNETDYYTYSPGDPRRSHIMPSRLSARGSLMWQVIDIRANTERWIERRDLSDRILAGWAPVAQS